MRVRTLVVFITLLAAGPSFAAGPRAPKGGPEKTRASLRAVPVDAGKGERVKGEAGRLADKPAALRLVSSAEPKEQVEQPFVHPPSELVHELERIKGMAGWRMKPSAVQLARKALSVAERASYRYLKETDPEVRDQLLERALEANYIIESLQGMVAANGYRMFLTSRQQQSLSEVALYLGLDRGRLVKAYHDRHPELPDPIEAEPDADQPSKLGVFNPMNLAQKAARGGF